MSRAQRWRTAHSDNHNTQPRWPAYVWGLLISRNNPTSASWEDAIWANNPTARCPDLNPLESAPF